MLPEPTSTSILTSYEITSYYRLRQAIGVLGIFLAPVLTLGSRIFGHCQISQPSISHYYYSIMHIVFVGTLCVLGGFLLAYRVKNKLENTISNLAGLFAFGVATFPTGFKGFAGPGGDSCQFISIVTANPDNFVPGYVGKVHFIFAGLLFTCFAIFCFKFFQELDEGSEPGIKKQRRNRVYRACGWMIVASIALIGAITLYDSFHKPHEIWPDYIYWLETTSLVPFGFSWLLKGSGSWAKSRHGWLRNAISYFR